MTKQLIPKRRFITFDQEWEFRRVHEVMEVTSVKRIHQSDWQQEGVRFLRARDIVSEFKGENVESPLYISVEKYVKYAKVTGVPQKEDLLVTGVGTIGIPKLINDNKPLYFKDGNIIWFKNNGCLDGWYFYYYFLSKRVQSYIRQSSGSGTVGTYTIENGKRTPLLIPSKVEQQKIGEFFKVLDARIANQERKIEKIKAIKQAYLTEMFPQEGEDVPKRRFKGFNEIWNEKYFGEIITKLSASSESSNLPSVEYEDIIPGTGILNKDVSKKKNKKEGLLFSKGDILFGKLRPYLKNWLLADFEGIAVGDFWVFRPLEVDSDFLYFLIQTSNYQRVSNLSIGTKMPRSDWNTVSCALFGVPNQNEQQKIGEFFKTLDEKIESEEKKLEKLKKMKEAFLEEMFV